MNAYVYILFSEEINKFYTGSTALSPEERLDLHLSGYYTSKKFTAKAQDWQLFLQIPCKTIEQARQIELHIKNMKSSQYIRNLKRYPEMKVKLLNTFNQAGSSR